MDIDHVSHDEVMSQLIATVGIVGTTFTFDKFSYQENKGAYHADHVAMTDGFDFHDLNYSFEDGVFVSATAKRDTSEGSQMALTFTADSYGSTTVKLPSYYS